MIQVFNQIRRVWSDDGRGDKDFSDQETRLQEVQQKLVEATDLLRQASETLTGLIKTKGLH
ncbi:hypothetical protein CK489_15475 [Bradyrhizobium sp. UFLA03-84]|uniref:hypothetical protein n=1 Tax=Bradyrhizobium sp. UFLA03-84 TaxID=418599 RepID=UPI000BAE27E5|nr:hypothetical protein [Bradyrhizobium sp. UFLA03-84]PAY07198.1 hypothetical protein CK489_15475 [Bradyrhizobium sp. UFLA03-84]